MGRVRRLASQRRVGHAGTLDPMASGVLPVLLGRATRLADFLHLHSKTYVADVCLGIATDTEDADGTIIAVAPVALPPDLEPTLARFRGPIQQTPPRFSAIKVAGQRAYAAARRGESIDLQPRQVTIFSLTLLNLATRKPTPIAAATHSTPTPTMPNPPGTDPDAALPTLTLEVTCSTGTYIRALARDLAQALGTVGYLTRLVRTRVGPFCLDDSVSLERLADLAPFVQPPDAALPEAPELRVDADTAARLLNGQSIPTALHAEVIRVYDPSGRLMCIGTANGALLRSRFLL